MEVKGSTQNLINFPLNLSDRSLQKFTPLKINTKSKETNLSIINLFLCKQIDAKKNRKYKNYNQIHHSKWGIVKNNLKKLLKKFKN